MKGSSAGILLLLLASLASLGAVLGATAQAQAVVTAAARPNFLFVYADDQRWDAMGVVQREQGERARFPWFQTPNMDRLAAEGVRFRNAFVVHSLCSPSRAAFLTGLYNHLNGVANNHTPFPANSITHAALLRAAGYRTGYIGKWHMGQQRGPRPGFDYSASYVAHGRYDDCPFEIDGARTETMGWVDDVATDFAIEFLKQNQAKPFLLIVGYKSPHGPRTPPARWQSELGDVEAKPAVTATNFAPYRGKVEAGQPAKAQPAPARASEAPHGPGPELVRNYFRTIAAVDENLGRLLATLDELRLAENTVVVYASDNGFFLGEHGLGDKRAAYEESIRIPLLLRYPKLGDRAKGKVIDALALNIDLAPTFLDLASVPVPAQMQGKSWRPLLESKPAAWRKSFFYEYFYEKGFAITTVLAVRTESAKLIRYPGHDDWTELFDLKADPNETRNLAGDARGQKLLESMKAEFERQAKSIEFRIPEYADPVPADPKKEAKK